MLAAFDLLGFAIEEANNLKVKSIEEDRSYEGNFRARFLGLILGSSFWVFAFVLLSQVS